MDFANQDGRSITRPGQVQVQVHADYDDSAHVSNSLISSFLCYSASCNLLTISSAQFVVLQPPADRKAHAACAAAMQDYIEEHKEGDLLDVRNSPPPPELLNALLM